MILNLLLEIKKNIIMKILNTLLFLLFFQSLAIAQINGRVVAKASGEPLEGVTVRPVGLQRIVKTDRYGTFIIPVNERLIDTLEVSHVGYHTLRVGIIQGIDILIHLEDDKREIQEVEIISTGYQSLPRERATGSFSYIDNESLQQIQSKDIISRLEGVGNSLLFDRRRANNEDPETLNLRIRGASSIYANQYPLIIVDGFPFEGDLMSINPNDVEDVTILKDAAAASIWGARAANGVIVVRLKQGTGTADKRISFTTSTSLYEKPNLFKNSYTLGPEGTLEWERLLFDKGHFDSNEQSVQQPALSEAVELFIKQRDGLIQPNEYSAAISKLINSDIRADASKYLYRRAYGQQLSLAFQGVTAVSDYYLSGSLDIHPQNIEGNGWTRKTVNIGNNLKLGKKIQLFTSLFYSDHTTSSSGLGLHNLHNVPIYTRLADNGGNPLPVIRDYRQGYVVDAEEEGLLNWQYIPLMEIGTNHKTTANHDLHLSFGTDYKITEGFQLQLKYKFEVLRSDFRDFNHENSYIARNAVNRFTQSDGTRLIMPGAIIDDLKQTSQAHNGRLQLNYNKTINSAHTIDALIGSEVRQRTSESNGFRLYGYDDDILSAQNVLDFVSFFPVLPASSARINAGYNGLMSGLIDRFVSYYTNIGYDYAGRYQFSLSARRDASNLFGVRQNQRWVPLWSVGGAWNVSNEPFYNSSWLENLRLRLTWGHNGNIDKSTSAYLTAQYLTDNLTRLPYAQIQNPGNPALKWETTGILNLGFDFAAFEHRLSGSVEYYSKRSKDMLGQIPAESTTGFIAGGQPPYSYKINYADMHTQGVDIELEMDLIKTPSFLWSTAGRIAFVENKITKYEFSETSTFNYLTTSHLVRPRVGYSLDALYSLPWAGLDPNTGDPRYYLNGQVSLDYAGLRNFPADQLVYHGLSVPPLFGSLINTIRYRGLSLTAHLGYRGRYYFKRNSVYYSMFNSTNSGHMDFVNRWRSPGDELVTDVPSIPSVNNANRDRVYADSEILKERADHIRLNNISVAYNLNPFIKDGGVFKTMQIAFIAQNMGLIWRKNQYNLDPEWYGMLYEPPANYTLRVNITL